MYEILTRLGEGLPSVYSKGLVGRLSVRALRHAQVGNHVCETVGLYRNHL